MSVWRYSKTRYRRRPTRTVDVGHVAVGGCHPIRVQSMTTPATTDTGATIAQIARLAEAGCEIVRVTVPTSADATNLPVLRAEMHRRGIRIPLVADIHFTPRVAMAAVEHVEKIRINPGNFADKKRFAVREYSDVEYRRELERISEVFSPLVLRARELGVAMRIGTNHGSLSDRIMNRYGDTPEGMVESALEFVRICEQHGYRNLILSMKASNPFVVLQAYRLLVERMAAEGMDYPLHLGVTEAGDGDEARIKSALGIGTLLDEGIGDTVRVSLTEDPVREIPVARALVAPYNAANGRETPARGAEDGASLDDVHSIDPAAAAVRRDSRIVRVGPHEIGARSTVRVEVPLASSLDDPEALRAELDGQAGVRVPEETRAEIVGVTIRRADQIDALERFSRSVELVAPSVGVSARLTSWEMLDAEPVERWAAAAHRLHVGVDAARLPATGPGIERLAARARALGCSVLVEVTAARPEDAVAGAASIAGVGGIALALAPSVSLSPLHLYRRLVERLETDRAATPIVLLDRPSAREADPLLGPASALGGLLCDGVGDAIHVDVDSADRARRLGFGILQAARVRITRTEFISCPSCGRTLFDLEETTARIKRRTAHLKGVKIAIMGCVVNGPGEMADADFGYVGWGERKIALFVGKEMVAKDIPTEEADERLVELIKRHGRWVDPPVLA